MAVDKTYVLPLEGQSDGLHKYNFHLHRGFFKSFEYTDFTAEVDIVVELLKDAHVTELNFEVKGFIDTDCDRCLRGITIPIEGHYKLILKYGNSDDTDDEILYIPEGAREVNLKHYFYEFTGLLMPMIHTCADTEHDSCPDTVRDMLDREAHAADEEKKSSVWDALEDLEFDKEN